MATPKQPRKRRPSEDVRNAHLKAHAISIARRAAFGPDHPAVAHTVEHLDSQPNCRTARYKADHLLGFLDWCHRRGFDPFMIRRVQAKIYYSDLPQHLARSSRHQRTSAIRSWYLDAIDAGLCSNNPFYRVGPRNIDPRVPTPYINIEQIDRVLAYQNERFERGVATPVQCRDSVLFYVMTRVGPRRFEAAGARWDNGAASRRSAAVSPSISPARSNVWVSP